ncbi:type II toxin-antitoxin system RelE/ParE family toxin [Rhizobium sp. F40D2]|uniref:type II toxin-antitoxin system RelE/ParE family toxin n=1 Tax=Rhizobium sp. F40D2 TaxID=3453141 RepID=UPI003F1FBAF2
MTNYESLLIMCLDGKLTPLLPERSFDSVGRKDYADFPPKVQEAFGFELFLAQTGQHPPSAKMLKGLGNGIVELVEDHDSDTYRAVYTTRFDTAVYVLHCFKKQIQARHQNTPERYRAD